MNWNKLIRQIHRWLGVIFTLAVIANFVVLGLAQEKGEYPVWLGVLSLGPLALLWFSGMYLFVLPYVIKWRSARRID
jgi:hypothetical protein